MALFLLLLLALSAAGAGQRVLLGSTRAFALRARLPRDPDSRRWTLAELRLTQQL